MVLSYVRDLLESITGERPVPDQDGDLLVGYGGAKFHVRVVDAGDPVVQVFSIAVADLEPTPELMVEINEINQNIGFARAFHVRDQVLIESEIWGDDVNPVNFQYACGNVAAATDRYAGPLVEKFGGTARFDQTKEPDYQASGLPQKPSHGAYL